MIPLRIVADMETRLVLPAEGIHLDALLMSAVARRDNLPPLTTMADARDCAPPPIPIALSACERYYLCTTSIAHVEGREHRWVNRRFPLAEAVALGGPTVKRLQLSAGAAKGYRIPVEATHARCLTWYAIGDLWGVRELLSLVTRLGRRRAVGEGTITAWRIDALDETWPGFPTHAADGAPMRNLPVDAVTSGPHVLRVGRVRPPYWSRSGEEMVAAPCL